MPLLELKTDLTSLKYGSDRPGGGSSPQPFITKDIPGANKPFISQINDERTGLYGMTVGNDFGFRNALLNSILNGGDPLEDNKRILDLYFKTSTGLVFEAKQILIGLAAGQDTVWNPLAVNLQELANVIGVGHIPSYINGDLGTLFQVPFPNTNKLKGFGSQDENLKLTGVGQSREDFFKMGNPATDTNNLLKGGLGKSTKRNDYVKGITDKKTGDPIDSKITGDTISLTSLYKASQVNQELFESDMIKFMISVVDNDDPSQRTWIHFRAYIDSFSDSFSANYNSQKYVGRGEEFYNYGGFSRSINMGFKIGVQSRAEQKPLYEKLTYLASVCAPDYSDEGFMRGSIVYLTVGDYLVDVPGVLKGISFSGFESSNWEIARKPDGTLDPEMAQLPHSLTVSGFSFSPIHNGVPRKGYKFIGYDKNPLTQDALITATTSEPVIAPPEANDLFSDIDTEFGLGDYFA